METIVLTAFNLFSLITEYFIDHYFPIDYGLRLTSLPTDIFQHLNKYLTPGCIIVLVDVSRFFRNIYKSKLRSDHKDFLAIYSGLHFNRIQRGTNDLKNEVILDAIYSDNINLLRHFKYIGISVKNTFLARESAKYGALNILKHLYLMDKSIVLISGICLNAVKGGHLEMLQWICTTYNGRFKLLDNGRQWNTSIPAAAAKAGYFDIFRWSVENGCPWDDWTIANAARCGNIFILQWLVAKYIKCNGSINSYAWSDLVHREATKGDNVEVLQWINDNKCPWQITRSCRSLTC